MLYFGQPFYALANNIDSDLFSNNPFSNGPPAAKTKNSCKARFIFKNIFYLNTSLDAPWRNPGCDWTAWGCILYVGRCWCCNIPSCFSTTVAVPGGSGVGFQECFVKDVQTWERGNTGAFAHADSFGNPTTIRPTAQHCRGLPWFLRNQAVMVFLDPMEREVLKILLRVLWCSAVCLPRHRGFAVTASRVLIQALEGDSSQSPLAV